MNAPLPLAADTVASAPHPVDEGTGGHACGCHEAEATDPVLDARAIPHAVRHGAIFGALDAVGLGHALVLVAPHDPLPLLAQLKTGRPGEFAVEYLQRGPKAWHLRLTRRTLGRTS